MLSCERCGVDAVDTVVLSRGDEARVCVSEPSVSDEVRLSDCVRPCRGLTVSLRAGVRGRSKLIPLRACIIYGRLSCRCRRSREGAGVSTPRPDMMVLKEIEGVVLPVVCKEHVPRQSLQGYCGARIAEPQGRVQVMGAPDIVNSNCERQTERTLRAERIRPVQTCREPLTSRRVQDILGHRLPIVPHGSDAEDLCNELNRR